MSYVDENGVTVIEEADLAAPGGKFSALLNAGPQSVGESVVKPGGLVDTRMAANLAEFDEVAAAAAALAQSDLDLVHTTEVQRLNTKGTNVSTVITDDLGNPTWMQTAVEGGGQTEDGFAIAGLQDVRPANVPTPAGGLVPTSDHPRLTRPRATPIFSKVDTDAQSIYWSWFKRLRDGKLALFYSTDHAAQHENSGIWRATSSDGTVFGTFTQSGPSRVFRDDYTGGGALGAKGAQTETPAIMDADDGSGELWMTYQQQDVFPPNNQSTLWVKSTDGGQGLTWTQRQGGAAVGSLTLTGDGHTGYLHPLAIFGHQAGYGLHGGTDQGTSAFWRRDPNKLGQPCYLADPVQMSNQVHRMARLIGGTNPFAISGEPNEQTAGGGKTKGWGISFINAEVVSRGGRLWIIAVAGPSSSGENSSIKRVVTAPLRDDLHGLAADPVDITPPAVAWEGVGITGIGNLIEENGHIYLTYRAGGADGKASFGIWEVI